MSSPTAPAAPTVSTAAANEAERPKGPPPKEELEHMTWAEKVASLIGVVGPVIALIVAIIIAWRWDGFSWLYATMLGVGYVLTALGVTVGYHRYFTHKSFETNAVVKAFLAFLGSTAVEGPPTKWAAMHRCHHQHSDHDHDPHSPHHHGGGVWGIIKGFFHAHVGWIFRGDPQNLERYNPDLRADKVTNVMSKLWVVWAMLGFLIPTAIGGLVTMSWTGALLGFLWGGLVRLLVVHHVTWSINSVCHIWGSRPFKSNDESRNNWFFGWFGLGEGWHNNHHAFPSSARHGLRWWEFDLSYLVIRGMEAIGLVHSVKVPSRQILERKRQPHRH